MPISTAFVIIRIRLTSARVQNNNNHLDRGLCFWFDEERAREQSRDDRQVCDQGFLCKGNVSSTSYSRTFYDTQMATANCVHPHAQLEQA